MGDVSVVDTKRGLSLKGARFDIRELESVAFILKDQETLRGLYRLTFSDGERYVGQSVNVASRFTSHHRRWDDIVTFEFFPIAEGDLNESERQLIWKTEDEVGVRNIREAHRPGGDADIEVSVQDHEAIILPWDRDRRVKLGNTVTSKATQKFHDLVSHPTYDLLRDLVGWYIYETIPDPQNTQRHLWTVSCLPSTSKLNRPEFFGDYG